MSLNFRIALPLVAAIIYGTTTCAATPPQAKAKADIELLNAEKQQRLDEKQQRLDAANQRLEQAAREVAELSSSMSADHLPDALMFLGHNPNRAMLGIAISGPRDHATTDGVTVLSVSPGGPAASAGIKAGDVIVELNGKNLKTDDDDNSNEKLMDELAKVAPGDEVSLRYRRDGKSSMAKLRAEKLPRQGFSSRTLIGPAWNGATPSFEQFGDHSGERPDDHRGVEERRIIIRRGPDGLHDGPLGSLELISLTPKLGQYFGADKGLLIVRAPQDKDLKLEEGDVLVDIDGRAPNNPSHAFRILDSYQPGEKLSLNILRQHKKMAVALTVPVRDREFRAPVPPTPPTPPRPPRDTKSHAPEAAMPATPSEPNST